MELDERFLRRGDALPDLDQVDGLLILGGEQSLREIDSYPYLLEEVELLRSAVERELPTLGVCLGGQLLARSQGAEISHLPQRVIGWPEVSRTEAGEDDPLFGGLPAGIPALHWNEDCFSVPPGAVEILSRSNLGGEAIRVGERAWGVQFHPEADEAILEGWYEWDGLLEEAGMTEADARAADERWIPTQRAHADVLFGTFARLVAGG